ncbi:MAG: sensor histidine kinase [Rheinheimera sp.]|nr:MAG: sensor histidine kinase [Rheinheimera sp.]
MTDSAAPLPAPTPAGEHPARWLHKENLAAVLSWLVFAYIQQSTAMQLYGNWHPLSLLCAASLLLFIGLFFYCQSCEEHSTPWVALVTMWAALTTTAVLAPNGFAAGLGVLWCCLLPWFVPARWLYLMIVPALLPVLIMQSLDGLRLGEGLMILVCGTFQFFAMFAMSKAREEKLAREALAHTHQALLAAQSQLATQAADAERLRIARDLHDSLGHHLTALVIQLQVAGYQSNQLAAGSAAQEKTENTAQQALTGQINHCHELAKQLLQEIRHTVSQLREPAMPQLALQLKALAQNVPQLQLDLQITPGLPTDPLSTALLFRVSQEAITNTVRHSGATKAQLQVWQHKDQLCYRYRDNGQLTQWPLLEGNGLTGMRERIEQAGGSLLLSNPQHQLQIDIELPAVAP